MNKQSDHTIETLLHITHVINLLVAIQLELSQRMISHDRSKIHEPEDKLFANVIDKLKTTTYDSPEYHANLKAIAPAIEHHYQNNRHHPEHFEYGIDEMNLIDIVEMFCDWKAATYRHDDGNFRTSIDKNKIRFGMSEQLYQIFVNSIPMIEKYDNWKDIKSQSEFVN